MLNADATAGCNHVVILHGEMTTAWLAAGFGYPRRSWAGISETTYVGNAVFFDDCCPTLRIEIVRERWRASRLPSLRSALRGLDPRHALPKSWHLSERRLGLVGRLVCGSLLTLSWAHRRAESRFISVMPHARPA